jgi:hypothetical protein
MHSSSLTICRPVTNRVARLAAKMAYIGEVIPSYYMMFIPFQGSHTRVTTLREDRLYIYIYIYFFKSKAARPWSDASSGANLNESLSST